MNKFLSFEKISMVLALLSCAESAAVFRFFPARQEPEIILNESSKKKTENTLFEWRQKRPQGIFRKLKY
jgi:hypothetical protein